MNEQLPWLLRECFKAIGEDHAIQFTLKLGGATVYIAENPGPDSIVAQAIGQERARSLGLALGRGHVKVPVAKRWIARHLFISGWSKTKIARRLLVKDQTVNNYLRGLEPGSPSGQAPRQPDLFD